MAIETRKKTIIIFLVVFVCVIVAANLIRLSGHSSGVSVNVPSVYSTKKIARINITGPIYNSDKVSGLLESYGKDNSIKALILRIDSPGGGVSACQEICAVLKKFKREVKNGGYGKPVVVSFGTVAASGGYYIGCYGDRIFANPGTLTGSIGVIMDNLIYEDLMNKIGLKEEVIKSGKFKDTGSPARKYTTEERKLLQGVIDDVYSQFLDAIVEARGAVFSEHVKLEKKYPKETKVSAEEIREAIKRYSDGRIFTGHQAIEYGFVDEVGTLDDAIKYAAKLAKIEGEPEIVIQHKKPNVFDFVFRDNGETEEMFRGVFHKSGFSYLYGK
ncbi:MAG: signal peptide peptidase SppA [Candidatus Firestonebacteria bacterium]